MTSKFFSSVMPTSRRVAGMCIVCVKNSRVRTMTSRATASSSVPVRPQTLRPYAAKSATVSALSTCSIHAGVRIARPSP